mmetsp:Transcript_11306/g.21562  ORF Transcript_11306/g.21562 Transcript_11306/m.21562 type:complete len:256 (+) Transcript_11306:94-861(+)|eukprot:scaffold34921_cov162-Amphora_coffeaeformis.AAC.15
MKAPSMIIAAKPLFQIPKKQFAVVDCLELAMKINATKGESSRVCQEDCFGSVSSASSSPPLDQVTTCSEDCSDDVSSVSSCSLAEDPDYNFTPSSPRSIFKQFWTTQGQSHKLHRPVPKEISTQVLRLLTEEDCPAQNVYEETLREREDAAAGIASKRRSIFDNAYKPASAPSLRTNKCFDFRKIQSTSSLGQKPIRSCLRPSRYTSSGTASKQRISERSSDISVHFSEKIEVTLFQPSLERYAQEGWSDFFAYR